MQNSWMQLCRRTPSPAGTSPMQMGHSIGSVVIRSGLLSSATCASRACCRSSCCTCIHEYSFSLLVRQREIERIGEERSGAAAHQKADMFGDTLAFDALALVVRHRRVHVRLARHDHIRGTISAAQLTAGPRDPVEVRAHGTLPVARTIGRCHCHRHYWLLWSSWRWRCSSYW